MHDTLDQLARASAVGVDPWHSPPQWMTMPLAQRLARAADFQFSSASFSDKVISQMKETVAMVGKPPKKLYNMISNVKKIAIREIINNCMQIVSICI